MRLGCRCDPALADSNKVHLLLARSDRSWVTHVATGLCLGKMTGRTNRQAGRQAGRPAGRQADKLAGRQASGEQRGGRRGEEKRGWGGGGLQRAKEAEETTLGRDAQPTEGLLLSELRGNCLGAMVSGGLRWSLCQGSSCVHRVPVREPIHQWCLPGLRLDVSVIVVAQPGGLAVW